MSMKSNFVDFTLENQIAMFDLNVHAPFNHIQSILPHMIKNKSGQIVTIDSILGKYSTPKRASYTGTKHALNGMIDSIRS